MYKSLRKQILKVCKLLLILFFMSSCEDENITLVKNGTTDYEIVFLNSANNQSFESAEIFQKYIDKISNVKVPIVKEDAQSKGKHRIYIGNDSNENLDKNQIKITSKDKNLIISGGSDESTRNAVYEFLELYLGCKWLIDV